MASVSIIVRTKNEERWIGKTLQVIQQQTVPASVILVDNDSSDATVAVAKRWGVSQIVNIKKFLPGQALNEGIRRSRSEYIVCLSAHCIPQDRTWLHSLLRNFRSKKVAGVYGRQVPVAFTPEQDKRDLLITFGLDRRIQRKDPFFHNANSAIRRDVWKKIPFNEEVTNIEDRVWGQAVLQAGFHLVYEPQASVYHYHGIHQSNQHDRVRGTVSILERIETIDTATGLPDILKPEAGFISAILPILGPVKTIENKNLLENILKDLQESQYIQSFFILGNHPSVRSIARQSGGIYLSRPSRLQKKGVSVEDVVHYGLEAIERQGVYPDSVLYVNYLYPFRPAHFFDALIHELHYKGLDTVFPGFIDYQNYWSQQHDGSFIQVGESLKSRAEKQPLYRALYGLGSLTTTSVVRAGHLIGKRVGIVPITDSQFTLKAGSDEADALIRRLLE